MSLHPAVVLLLSLVHLLPLAIFYGTRAWVMLEWDYLDSEAGRR